MFPERVLSGGKVKSEKHRRQHQQPAGQVANQFHIANLLNATAAGNAIYQVIHRTWLQAAGTPARGLAVKPKRRRAGREKS
jgi:hypothetical protein